MKVSLEITESLSIIKSNVRFVASFFTQKDDFAKAFDAVFKDMNKFTKLMSDLCVPEDAIVASPVRANANWVLVGSKEKNDNTSKVEHELVQKGYVANGRIVVELPLSWADETHKFSAIYTAINSLKTKQNITYDFFADDECIENAKIALRGMVLDASRKKLNELMANQPSVSFELANVVYCPQHYGGGTRGMLSKNCVSLENSCASAAIPEPEFDADTIDNMISLDFAPEFEITDSVATKWKSVKNKKKKEK